MADLKQKAKWQKQKAQKLTVAQLPEVLAKGLATEGFINDGAQALIGCTVSPAADDNQYIQPTSRSGNTVYCFAAASLIDMLHYQIKWGTTSTVHFGEDGNFYMTITSGHKLIKNIDPAVSKIQPILKPIPARYKIQFSAALAALPLMMRRVRRSIPAVVKLHEDGQVNKSLVIAMKGLNKLLDNYRSVCFNAICNCDGIAAKEDCMASQLERIQRVFGIGNIIALPEVQALMIAPGQPGLIQGLQASLATLKRSDNIGYQFAPRQTGRFTALPQRCIAAHTTNPQANVFEGDLGLIKGLFA